MIVNLVKEKIYQIVLILMTIAFIGMSIFAIITSAKLNEVKLQLMLCQSENVDKSQKAQTEVNTKGKEYEVIKAENKQTTHTIEKRLETIIEKEPIVYRIECIDDDGLFELQKLYDAFPSTESGSALRSASENTGEDGKTDGSSPE